jgi:hypothetical protein
VIRHRRGKGCGYAEEDGYGQPLWSSGHGPDFINGSGRIFCMSMTSTGLGCGYAFGNREGNGSGAGSTTYYPNNLIIREIRV